MATHNTHGTQAETLACEYITDMGYKVISRNWRTRFCEIDIVAKNQDFVLFVEVKYRRSGTHGGALGAVSKTKLHQMGRSAEFWLLENPSYSHLQPRLDVVAITGDLAHTKVDYVENCSF